ncbi:hypothetical protein BOTBODRAFT_398033 [Botryobasidium botryosum FD-172 SS1]|uniref:Uncharacterized protein n=1 Tax=Botryobasidium botryosum (strain FD-172 SS1) TaxID=930990 RepID=A0A067MCA5_BOTB1|nr:hypothetical protein BOTBODRAFT_398033 [Botryobasidium botryosum FD-172 SS1]
MLPSRTSLIAQAAGGGASLSCLSSQRRSQHQPRRCKGRRPLMSHGWKSPRDSIRLRSALCAPLGYIRAYSRLQTKCPEISAYGLTRWQS